MLGIIKKNIYSLYAYLSLFILKLFFSKRRSDENKNLLFVNTGFLGDIIISSLIMENENSFSNSIELYYLFGNDYKELFKEYKGNGIIIFFNLNRYRFDIFYKIFIIQKLRKLNLGYAINLTAARGLTNDTLTVFSGANVKLFISRRHFYNSDKIYRNLSKLYSSDKFSEIENEYEKHKRIINFLCENKSGEIKFHNNIAFNTNKSIKYFNINSKKFITIAPLSREDNKSWDLENYKALVEKLSKNFIIYLIGTSSQKKRLDELKNKNENIINTAGIVELNEIPTLLKKSVLYIGNDSGITHLAIKLNVPTIAIIGGGGYGRFFPIPFNNLNVIYLYHYIDCFGCDWICKYDEKYCLTKIELDEALQSIEIILKNT